jgi:uncharacterized delta-60 repeat protein
MKIPNQTGISNLLFLPGLLFVSFAGVANAQTLDALNPTANNIVYTAFQQPDGKMLMAGMFTTVGSQTHRLLARLSSDGSLDTSFPGISSGDYIYCLALQTNGQVLAGGSFSGSASSYYYANIVRLNSNGTVDKNFSCACYGGSVYDLLIQPDNKILVAGYFASVNSSNVMGLCRLNLDGSLDTNFNAGANGPVIAIALQPDGKILAEGGFFTSIGGLSRTNLVRLNSSGTLDTSFQTPAFTCMGSPRINGGGGVVLVQPDAKILVGGLFDSVNGQIHTNIVRLNADGTLDTAFNLQADYYSCWGLLTLTMQTDGKIIVGHDSYRLNGTVCRCLGRLNADGSLDAGFKTNLSIGTMVFSAGLQPDGRILTGGWFTSLDGQSRSYLGRFINTEAATQCLSYDGTNLTWLRGGTSPEVWRTSFESSPDGLNWTYLGDGQRITGGWQLANVTIPTNATVRARGFITGGKSNGSSWFVETAYPQTAPRFVMTDGKFGVRTNQFGSSISGSAGSTVVTDGSSDLLNWTPIVTNVLYTSPIFFADPSSTNSPAKFYRMRLQ